MASNQAEIISSSSAEVIEPRVERLFLRLSAIYGYLWWNMYQNEELLRITKIEWSTSLKRFDIQILKEALLSYREKKGYPPTLPEFMDCCNELKKRFEPCLVAQRPTQPANEAIAKQNIQAMYAILKR